jgi:hypothetical protein
MFLIIDIFLWKTLIIAITLLFSNRKWLILEFFLSLVFVGFKDNL